MSDSYGDEFLSNPASRAAESAIQDAFSENGTMGYLRTQDHWDCGERELYNAYMTPNGLQVMSIFISDSKIRTKVRFGGKDYSSAEYPLDVDPEMLIDTIFADMDKAAGIEPE